MSDELNEVTEQGTTETTETKTADPWPEGTFTVPVNGKDVEVSGKDLWDLASRQKAGEDKFEEASRLRKDMQADLSASDTETKYAGIGKAWESLRSAETLEDQFKLGKEVLKGSGMSDGEADEYLNAWYAVQTEGEQTEGQTGKQEQEEDDGVNETLGQIVGALTQVADRIDKIESSNQSFKTDLDKRTVEDIRKDFFSAAENDENLGRYWRNTGAVGTRAKEMAWNKLLELSKGSNNDYDETQLFKDAIEHTTAFFQDTVGDRSGSGTMPSLGGFGSSP